MTGNKLWETVLDGDTAKVSTLLSTQGAESFVNSRHSWGHTVVLCVKVIDKLPAAPEGEFVRVPHDFADMEKATRGARDGQTILVEAGETMWYDLAWIEVLH